MERCCTVWRLVQGKTGRRNSTTGRTVMLEVRQVTSPLLLRKTISCLPLGERVKSLSKTLLWSHAIVVVAHESTTMQA